MELIKALHLDDGSTQLVFDNDTAGWLMEGETMDDACKRICEESSRPMPEVVKVEVFKEITS